MEKTENLRDLLAEAEEFRLEKFKNPARTDVIHIPYSGCGDQDYTTFHNFLMADVYDIIEDIVNEKEITSVSELSEVWEHIDDDGRLHEFIDSSLAWHLDIKEAAVIINGCKNKETDSGLWEGLQPEQAISAKAFWTYKEEVSNTVQEKIEEFIEE